MAEGRRASATAVENAVVILGFSLGPAPGEA